MEEKILELLNSIQSAIMGIAPKTWEIMVYQHFVNGMIWIVIGIIMLIFVGLGMIHIYKRDVAEGTASIDEKEHLVITYFIFVVFVFWLEITPIKEVINPSYYAIVDLINFIK